MLENRAHVLLSAQSGKSVQAELIHIFHREDDIAMTEAPTFRNMALTIFQQTTASRVALVATAQPVLLFLIEIGHRWFDATGAPVHLTALDSVYKQPCSAGTAMRQQSL